MKKTLFFLAFLAFSAQVFAQVVSNGPGGFTWVDSPPTHNPGQNGAKFAVNRNTFIWYEWVSGTTWAASGDRIQTISGCSAPNYTPGNHQSRVVINGCTPTPELYAYTGSVWVKLNSGTTYTAGAGINISGTTISADTAVLATQYDLSQVGVSWPLLAPDGLDTVPSYSFINSPQTGIFLLPGRFSALDLGLRGGYRANLSGVGISAIAGSSGTGNGGRVSFLGGSSDFNNGGGVDFQGGAATGSDPTKRGGDVSFAGGTSSSGIGGNISFNPGSGPTSGTLIFRGFYTPTSTADVFGERGSFSTDDNYLYTKTDLGWKRAQLTTLTELTGTGNRLAILNSSGQFQRGTTDPANVVAVSGPTTGQIPKWNGTAWIPANDSIGGGGGTPGGSNTQIQFNNSGVFGGSSNLVWDNTLSSLGVGTTALSNFRAVFRGSGNTSATSAFLAENSDGTDALDVRNDGLVIARRGMFVNGASASSPFAFYRAAASGGGDILYEAFGGLTTGSFFRANVNGAHIPFDVKTAGTVIRAAGSTAQNTSATLEVQSTTGGLLPPRMTTTQRDAIASPADGLMLYSSTAADMQLRAGGLWTDIAATLKATATLDFPSTPNHSNSDLTITVTGAAVGDGVTVSPGLAAISNHSCYTAWVSAANTVTVRFNHYGGGGATDPASASFNVIVTKF